MKEFLLAVFLALAVLAASELWPVHMYADGSDPMPICKDLAKCPMVPPAPAPCTGCSTHGKK
jgi:hypothetical protein